MMSTYGVDAKRRIMLCFLELSIHFAATTITDATEKTSKPNKPFKERVLNVFGCKPSVSTPRDSPAGEDIRPEHAQSSPPQPAPNARSAKLSLRLRRRIVTMMRRRSASVAPAPVLPEQDASAGQERGPEGDPPARDNGSAPDNEFAQNSEYIPDNECTPDKECIKGNKIAQDSGRPKDNGGTDVAIGTDVNHNHRASACVRGTGSDVMEWGASLEKYVPGNQDARSE